MQKSYRSYNLFIQSGQGKQFKVRALKVDIPPMATNFNTKSSNATEWKRPYKMAWLLTHIHQKFPSHCYTSTRTRDKQTAPCGDGKISLCQRKSRQIKLHKINRKTDSPSGCSWWRNCLVDCRQNLIDVKHRCNRQACNRCWRRLQSTHHYIVATLFSVQCSCCISRWQCYFSLHIHSNLLLLELSN